MSCMKKLFQSLEIALIIVLIARVMAFTTTVMLLKLLIALGVAWAAWRRTGKRAADSHEDSHADVNDKTDADGTRNCSYAFTDTVLDLTDVELLPERVKLSCAFSSVSVRLPVDAAVTIRSNGTFCCISAPGQKDMILGKSICYCGTKDDNAPRLLIDANCAFGSLEFMRG